MAQTVDLLVKVQDAEAKVKLDKITNDIRKAQQLAQEGMTITSSSVKENADGLVTAITKYIDAEKRLITLKQQEYVVQEEIRDEEGKITQERQTAIRDTKTISTNYAQIAKELSRMKAESAKITAETERLAQSAERAKAAFAKSLTGKTRENYQNGGYSAEFASEVQSATTVAWQQYSASLTEAYQKQSQLNAETSMFGQISDSAFAQYSSGAMSAAVAQKDVNTAQEQSVESIAHGIVTAQKFFDTMNGVGRQCGVTADEVSVFAELSDDAFHKYAGGLMSASDANKTLKNSTKEVTEETKKSRGEFTLLNTVFLRLAHTAISAVTRSFREALTEMKNVDSELVVVRKVSDATAEELSALKERAYEVGSAYGVAASDYLSAAAEMTRAGYRDQAGDLAELATKLQLVGDVSQDVANQFLIATDKSYKMNGNYQKLSETIDKLNEIDNNFATSFEKVADGIGLLAPVASQANVSFDEMAAAIGTVTAVTQRSGTESARALRSLFLNIIKDTNTEIEDGVTWTVDEINNLSDALKKYAPDVVRAAEATGELINPMEAVGALAQSYKEGLLTNKDLFDIVSGLGGKLRTSQLLALIQNWDMYNEMLEKTANAAGSADKEVNNALDSWNVKLNQLKNTFTEFVEKSLSSDFVKGMLDSVKGLIEGFGSLGTVVGILGSAFVALNISRVINWFTQLGSSVKAIGGGFKAVITVLANYKTASKAGAVGTEAFNTALKGTSLAASVAKIAITALAVAISAAIIAYNKIDQSQKEKAEASEKLAQATGEESKRLDELYKKYLDAKDGSEQQKKASDELREALDLEAGSVENLSDKYKELSAEKRKQSTADYYDSVLDRENLLRRNLNPFTSIFGGKIGKSSKIDLNKMFNDSQSGVAIKDMLGIYAGDWNEIFAKYNKAESNAENLIGLYTDINALLDKMKIAREKGDSVPEQGFNILKNWATQSEEYVNAYEDSWKSYVQAKAYEDAWSDSTIKNIKTQEDFDAALKKANQSGIRGYGDAMKLVLEQMFPQFAKKTEDVTEAVEEQADSIDGLTKKLEGATEALKNYKKALEGGEKGDTLKSYSEAYKKAVEMYEKGLTGSNQYMSAIDLLFGDVDDYEAAGELLGNAFVKAMFEGGGEDYGANAANWIRENIDTLKGVALQEAEDGTFGLDFFDVDAFAESMGMSADAVWVLIDALDAYNSRTVYTREQLFEFMGQVDNGLAKTVNLSEVINNLASEGKTKKQIKEIVEAIQDLANTDGTITIEEPQNLDQTIDDIIELNNEADKDKDMDVVLTSNSEEFFDGIKKEIEQINGTTIYIGLKTIDKPSLKEQPFVGGVGGGSKTFTNILTQSQAEGTRYNRGGLSLVNEEGAELIYANGKAWIAGGGEPTIENLPVGAGVFNAKETREILTRSGIPSFLMGRTNREEPTLEGTGNYKVYNGATVGGLPKTDNGSGSQSGTSGKTPTETKLEDLLESLNTYIDDLLKRAQDALKAQTEAIDAQIDALKRQHDAEENANDLEELRLKILEAEKNLLDAENERTVRYFNQATGQWEWMADQKAVADARKKLEDAQKAYDDKIADLEYEAQIQALQDQKDALNDAYSSLSDNWDNIKEQIEDIVNGTEAVNITELLSKLGLTSASGSVQDVQSLLSAISAFESDVNAGKYNVNSVSLDTYTTDQILSMSHNGAVTNALSQLLGISTADLSSNGQSVFSSSTATTVAGDTIYYINGIKLGSDEASKPLSEILSVLPIYANH